MWSVVRVQERALQAKQKGAEERMQSLLAPLLLSSLPPVAAMEAVLLAENWSRLSTEFTHAAEEGAFLKEGSVLRAASVFALR